MSGTKRKPPKRIYTRTEADRDSTRVCLRLPKRTAEQLDALADSTGQHRVTVICDLVERADEERKEKR